MEIVGEFSSGFEISTWLGSEGVRVSFLMGGKRFIFNNGFGKLCFFFVRDKEYSIAYF